MDCLRSALDGPLDDAVVLDAGLVEDADAAGEAESKKSSPKTSEGLPGFFCEAAGAAADPDPELLALTGGGICVVAGAESSSSVRRLPLRPGWGGAGIDCLVGVGSGC